MSVEQRARILKVTATSYCGIRELIQMLNMKTSNVISLLKKMDEEQLVQIRLEHTSKKGRPKKSVRTTPLGCDFLDAYDKLKMKPLRARKEDLLHATEDAKYADRLVENGHSSFETFLELNTIARYIENSSKNH